MTILSAANFLPAASWGEYHAKCSFELPKFSKMQTRKLSWLISISLQASQAGVLLESVKTATLSFFMIVSRTSFSDFPPWRLTTTASCQESFMRLNAAATTEMFGCITTLSSPRYSTKDGPIPKKFGSPEARTTTLLFCIRSLICLKTFWTSPVISNFSPA